MAKTFNTILIVGSGIFGVTAAVELRRRGHTVRLFDPGPLPHPDAASTDISKVLRMDYGRDEFYTELMEESFTIWDQWNEKWERPLFHQTGFLMMSRYNWKPGGFEYDSYQMMVKRGNPTVRLSSAELKKHYPAWKAENYPEGYFNPRAGWAESGQVVAEKIKEAKAMDVDLREGVTFERTLEKGGKVLGFVATNGEEYHGDLTIVAGGAWTPSLLPQLQDVMWATGQAVLHFRVEDVKKFQPPLFPVWNADIENSGWYGFPAKDYGTLKVANHGPGWRVDARDLRVVPKEVEAKFRAFFADTFPDLVNAPKIFERLCLYCDTFDGNFWIDHDPEREGLMVSCGGSGHAFKFAPMLGTIAADVAEGRPNKYAHRFAWRARGDLSKEHARYAGGESGTPRK